VAPSLVIRERRLEDDPAIVHIRNQSSSNWPPMNVQRYRDRADPSRVPAGGIMERYVGMLGDHVVGITALGGNWYFQRPATFTASIAVDRQHQGRGFGRTLWQWTEEHLSRHGATRIYASLAEDQDRGIKFAQACGFSPTGRAERISRLIVAEANLEGYDGLDRKFEASGIIVRRLEEFTNDEDFLHRLHDMMFEAEKDIPSSEEWTQDPFETWRRQMFESDGSAPDLFWMAIDDGQPVAMAALIRHTDTVVSNGLTATARSHRGQGLARALKKIQIDWCRENGVEQIYTGNDMANERMLSINVPLGYQAVPSQLEFVKDFETDG
jgi:GNAT superfamily N-acetyltransferase